MPKEIKKIVLLNPLAFAIFEFLRKYWGNIRTDDNSSMTIEEIDTVLQPLYKELNRTRPVDIQLLRNNLVFMVRLRIMKSDRKGATKTEKSRKYYNIDWDYLKNVEVVDNAGNKRKRSQTAPPIIPTPVVEVEKGFDPSPTRKKSGPKKLPPPEQIMQIRIMRAVPDLRTKIFRNAPEHVIDEDTEQDFKLTCTEDDIKDNKNKLGLEEFKIFYPDGTMDRMLPIMFHNKSHLEVVLREKEDGKKKVKYLAVIARLALDCILNGEPMSTDQEYPLRQDMPNLLVIDDKYSYVARVLGF